MQNFMSLKLINDQHTLLQVLTMKSRRELAKRIAEVSFSSNFNYCYQVPPHTSQKRAPINTNYRVGNAKNNVYAVIQNLFSWTDVVWIKWAINLAFFDVITKTL
jgi:hypothetical protein